MVLWWIKVEYIMDCTDLPVLGLSSDGQLVVKRTLYAMA
jgi:hypothetical protein